MDRKHVACGLVLVGLLLCGCSGGGGGDDSSSTEDAAPATSQPQGE